MSKYLVAFLAGSVATVLIGFASNIIIFFFGIVAIIFLFQAAFLVSGLLIGFLFKPEQNWKAGIWLSLPYALLVVYFLVNNYFFNLKYEGVFWRQEFFPVAALLYLAPVILACASVYAGSESSLRSVSLVVIALLFTVAGAVHMNSNNSVLNSTTHSFNLIESQDTHLQTEIKCEQIITKDYMRFRNSNHKNCFSKIFVHKKPSGVSLPTIAYVTINGVEQERSIYPQISGDSFGIDASKSQNFDQTKVWATEIPWDKIARSQQASFRWGKINIDFGESELKNLREWK